VELDLLKSGAGFTQNWMEFYSKLDGILLKSGFDFTQKMTDFYSIS